MKKHYTYLVCKKSFLGNLTPVKIFTALNAAKSFTENKKNHVILKQLNDGELEFIGK